MAKKRSFDSARRINAHRVWDLDELRTLRRQLAKAANQRLVRLENTKSDISGEEFTFGAYDIAMQYIEDSGRKRFSESLGYTPIGRDTDTEAERLQGEIDVLQGFLGMKSSRVKGMRDIEKARVQTFEDKGITFASNKEFYDFLNSETFKNLTNNYIFTSETLIEEFQKAAEAGVSLSDIKDAVESYRRHSKRPSVKGLHNALMKKAPKK